VWFLEGPRQLNTTLDLNLLHNKTRPSLTMSHRNGEGRVTSLLGQLLDRRHVLFTVSKDVVRSLQINAHRFFLLCFVFFFNLSKYILA
jgi:hypothetical protein